MDDGIRVPVNIAGVGAVGSHVCWLLAGGIDSSRIDIWDDDIVVPHNVRNQLFTDDYLGHQKVDAVRALLAPLTLTPPVAHAQRLDPAAVSGIVVLTVDRMEARREIVTNLGEAVAVVIDVRVGRTPRGVGAGVLYVVIPGEPRSMDRYRATLFPDEGALDGVCNQEIERGFAAFSAAIAAQVITRTRAGLDVPPRITWSESPLSVVEHGDG